MKLFDQQGRKSYTMGSDFGHFPAGSVSEGRIAVRSDTTGLWGYQNLSGDWVVPPRFDYAGPYSNGRAFVRTNDGWAYINEEGAPVTSRSFLWSYGEGLFSQDRAAVRTNSGWGYINRSGTWIVKPRYQWASRFHDGLAWVRWNNSKGFINRKGEWVLFARYDDARHFSNGLAPVKEGKHWGYINRSGDWVILPQFQWADPFTEKIARVRKNGKFGYIDSNGTWVIEPDLEQATASTEGKAVVDRNRIISSTGEGSILEDAYYINSFFQGMAAAVTPSGWNYFRQSGELLLKNFYQWTDDFSSGFGLVRTQQEWSLIDTGGVEKLVLTDVDEPSYSTGNNSKLVPFNGPGNQVSRTSSLLFREPARERYINIPGRCQHSSCWELRPYGTFDQAGLVEVTRYPYRTPTPSQLETAATLRLRSFKTAKHNGWFNYETAKNDGYRMVKKLDDKNAHHVNDTYLADGRILDPNRPENLIYYPTPQGRKLVGVMYTMNSNLAEGPQIGGPLTIWHYHTFSHASCRKFGQLPLRKYKGKPCEVGVRSKRSSEMLHVWFIDHPEGPFATSMTLPPTKVEKLSGSKISNRSKNDLKREVYRHRK